MNKELSKEQHKELVREYVKEIFVDKGRRLKSAKQALETIDRHKDIVEKCDSKLFGKAKFQKGHRIERWEHDSAVTRLKELGVKDKFDLRNQE